MSNKFQPDAPSDSELIASITPDVMECLAKERLFENLDDLLCPADRPQAYQCKHTFAMTESILRSLNFDGAAIADVLAVLRSKGACCDCETLYNVAEKARLKTRYWKAKAENL